MIDIGANLADESFATDLNAVLERARAAGLQHILVTGSSQASNQRAGDIASATDWLSSTAGLHPHHAHDWSGALGAQIRALVAQPHVVAVGESGLDYFRDLSPRAAQRAALTAQLDIAAETGMPVFLHQREAHADFVAILRDYRPALRDCVVHCFTDTGAALDDYLALDCHIGITGWICDERRGLGLREIVGRIPDQRLLVETDAPYLLPRTIRPRPKSRRCEPAHLPWVVDAVASARDQDRAHVARLTTENAIRLFQLPSVSAGAIAAE